MKFNGNNIQIGSNVALGSNVRIGDNTIIYDNVVLGDNVIISNNCIIGEPQNSYYTNEDYVNPKTIIGRDSLVRSHNIIYSGVNLGERFSSGHNVVIREETRTGEGCMFGNYSDVQGFCVFGEYCRLHSFVEIGQGSKIGNYVFMYPFVVLTNDPSPPSNSTVGVEVKDYAQIATGTVLLPGSKVGEHSLVAANSTVGGQFGENSFIYGSPAKRLGNLSELTLFREGDNKGHYPWPYNFDRGMPWQEIGYEAWLNMKRK